MKENEVNSKIFLPFHLAAQCAEGTEYSECGGSSTTCRSISDPSSSTGACYPGCYCVEGMQMNEAGVCVEIKDCECYHRDMVYSAGETVVIDSSTWYVLLS